MTTIYIAMFPPVLNSDILQSLYFEVYTCGMRLKRYIIYFVFNVVSSLCVWQQVVFISKITVDLAQAVTLLTIVLYALLLLKDLRWSAQTVTPLIFYCMPFFCCTAHILSHVSVTAQRMATRYFMLRITSFHTTNTSSSYSVVENL